VFLLPLSSYTLSERMLSVSMSLSALSPLKKYRMQQKLIEYDGLADIKIGIPIAEAEMGHDIRTAYNKATTATKRKADEILKVITAISLSGNGEEDKRLTIFAKVLNLEKILGID
jgi:hypothetical protein